MPEGKPVLFRLSEGVRDAGEIEDRDRDSEQHTNETSRDIARTASQTPDMASSPLQMPHMHALMLAW